MSDTSGRLQTALSGRYEIERELGSGGMATVYLAQDLRHARRVAIKVLRPELAAIIGAERFLTEIKTTANLQHPHILPLYDSGAADNFLFYVMPFIEGETVRDRLDREKQLPVSDALRIAAEVAGALQYAHRSGVIHRDIKPENILLHDGSALVADFGIALAAGKASGSRITETGMSLGTPHYMSPEQAMGERDITARADIYALGCVTYEMLAGEPPFTGPNSQAIVAKVLTEKPASLVSRRDRVPANVEAAVMTALEKLPADRFSSASEFAQALGNSSYVTSATIPIVRHPQRERKSNRMVAIAAGAASLAMILALWGWMRPGPVQETVRLDVDLGEVVPLTNTDLILSPDGSMIAFAGTVDDRRAIYVRRLNESEFRKLPGTDDAMLPSFSPDGREIVYRDARRNALLKADMSGAGSTILLEADRGGMDSPYDPHWGSPDWIVFVTRGGMYRIRATGGAPERINGGGRHPFLLPDGSGVLFSRGDTISFLDLETDSSTLVVQPANRPIYTKAGYLLYRSGADGLFAAPFDVRSRKITAPGRRVLDQLVPTGSVVGYSVAGNGTLVFHRKSGNFDAARRRLAVIAVDGSIDTLRLPDGNYAKPRISPDGRAIAYEFLSSDRPLMTDIHRFDILTGTDTRLTFQGDNDDPIWSPDGKRIAFDRDGESTGEDIFTMSADNSGEAVRLMAMPANQNPSGWYAGDTLLFSSISGENSDLYVLPPGSASKPRVYLNAPWSERDGALSSDHRLVAFTSTEAGRISVWIRTWPNPEGKWRVSLAGADGSPRWSADGRYVYFWRDGGVIDTLFRARVERNPIAVKPSEKVLTLQISSIFDWDIHPDGRRFAVAVPVSSDPTPSRAEGRRVVVLNWFNELDAMMRKGSQ